MGPRPLPGPTGAIKRDEINFSQPEPTFFDFDPLQKSTLLEDLRRSAS
jgi:hypothetical protein